MTQLFSVLRVFQRYNPKRIYLVLFTLIFASSFLILNNHLYMKYTKGSIQTVSEQIGFLSEKIDTWKHQVVETITTHENSTLVPALDVMGKTGPVKGVIVMFARNTELYDILETVRSVEERFNRKYKYDWMFINDSKHSPAFIQMMTALASGDVKFVNADRKGYFTAQRDLSGPKIRNVKVALKKAKSRYKMITRAKIVQQFWISKAFKIPEMKNYEYFLRINPRIELTCDINLDLFKFMRDNSKTYGFGMATLHKPNVFESLWPETLKYITKNSGAVHKNNLVDFISDDDSVSYNGCQFESMFEIGSIKFFQSEKYTKFAEYLSAKNGVFYENWQDSNVRTLAVSLLENKKKLQFFNNMGFRDLSRKDGYQTCPFDLKQRLDAKCVCDPADDITWTPQSCVEKLYEINGVPLPDYVPDHQALIEKAAIEREEERERKRAKDRELSREREEY